MDSSTPTKTPPLEKLTGVRGMNDVLPADEPLWRRFEEAVAGAMRAYGYRQIRTPIVEHTRLFVRGIGEVTDIVEKEMYSFTDSLNGEQLTLRPENTAGVVRAVIEHNLLYDGPKRLWYAGPMFRHERPQKGRYRQFHQVGAEALGLAGPDADAEVILLCQRLWDELQLPGVRLEINTLGAAHERRAHREALIAYFEAHRDQLDADAQRRLHANPLRILDTKNPAMQALVEAAPKLIDHLGPESLAHFERLQALLKSQNLPFRINPRLVRGLDYYNLTVFEWVADIGGTPLTICGGGRYDPLIEMLGGKPAPACGFAMGVERVLELLRAQGGGGEAAQCDVYVVHHGDETLMAALQAAERLRDAGLDVLLHCGGGSFKSQFKRADGSGAQLAVIVGVDELARGEVSVKPLRSSDGTPAQQQTVAVDQLVDAVLERFAAEH
ncbi:MAG: histidine--tRNA ligase [Burkholderiales bacterium]|nr:histidine--tRNA ligase [Burkholderiales bacterium]ODU62931.1 MAG: histidine--tRNA ligase [Lautropia sp. SCN 66-9]